MFNIKPISLFEWSIFGIGKFLMGVAVGMTFTGQYPQWIVPTFLAGIIFEVPSLIAVYKHQPKTRKQP